MSSKWSSNECKCERANCDREGSFASCSGLVFCLENGNSNIAKLLCRVFFAFSLWVGSRHAEGSSAAFYFQFARFPFLHGCNSAFVVQWNWIFLRSFLFDLHTDVYVDHTHLIGFEWQIDSHTTCESIARGVSWYSRGPEICPDLSSQVIVRLALWSCSFRFSLLINFASASATIPRHRWQGMQSIFVGYIYELARSC